MLFAIAGLSVGIFIGTLSAFHYDDYLDKKYGLKRGINV